MGKCWLWDLNSRRVPSWLWDVDVTHVNTSLCELFVAYSTLHAAKMLHNTVHLLKDTRIRMRNPVFLPLASFTDAKYNLSPACSRALPSRPLNHSGSAPLRRPWHRVLSPSLSPCVHAVCPRMAAQQHPEVLLNTPACAAMCACLLTRIPQRQR